MKGGDLGGTRNKFVVYGFVFVSIIKLYYNLTMEVPNDQIFRRSEERG